MQPFLSVSYIILVHAAFAIPVTCSVVFVVICCAVRKRNGKQQEGK